MTRISAVQRGFTLIELIIVIAIVGVLAAVAIPKFTNLSGNAQQAGTDGVAGGLGSASATNLALCQGAMSGCVATVGTCADVGTLLSGGMPAGYSSDTTALTAAGVSCTLTGPGSKVATYTGHKTN